MNQTAPGWFGVSRSMSVAAVRAEFASLVSAQVSQMDTAPATAKGMASIAGRQRTEVARRMSTRRASKMPAAGISGSTERALMAQFKKPVKTKVPTTQSISNRESESLRFHASAAASISTENPAAINSVN